MLNYLSKLDLTTEEQMVLRSEMERIQKDTILAYAFWLFMGFLGLHRFYLEKNGTGILMILTLGGLGIWWIIDAFLLYGMIQDYNRNLEFEIIGEIKKARMHNTTVSNVQCHL